MGRPCHSTGKGSGGHRSDGQIAAFIYTHLQVDTTRGDNICLLSSPDRLTLPAGSIAGLRPLLIGCSWTLAHLIFASTSAVVHQLKQLVVDIKGKFLLDQPTAPKMPHTSGIKSKCAQNSQAELSLNICPRQKIYFRQNEDIV